MNVERKPGRRFIAAVVALILTFALPCVVAASGPAPSVAPANPAFVSYIRDLSSGRAQEVTTEGHTLGLVPPPVALPKVTTVTKTMTLVGLPSTYDLRPLDKLTGIRNQGSCGACWTFGACGSLESSLKPLETWDFSENNLKNTSGFDLGPCDGGNQYMATAYLSRWDGPVNELDDPYDPYSTTSPPGLPVQKHLQDVDFIPDRTNPTDNDAIKRAVMTYGAVYTSFYWNAGYYNSSTFAYYYSGTASINHAVCIVGWDDSFPRSRFLSAPPGDGAFLIKNSWGSGWGDGGYFWISYYDSKAGTENALFRFAESTINYDHIYQYDPLGWVQSAGYSTETAWFANVFHAGSEEDLHAVGFYTPVPNSNYEVRVYLNPASGPTDPSGPVMTASGIIANPGYHTVQLDTPVALNPGDAFSVVVKLNTPGYNYPVPIEATYAGYSTASAHAGESFISADGSLWDDATSLSSSANVCLKAFTADRAALLVSPATNMVSTGPPGGPFSVTSQAYTLTNIGSTTLNWTAVRSQPWVSLSATNGLLEPGAQTTVTVLLNPAISGFEPGAYNDTVEFINETGGVGSTSRTVTLLIGDGYLTVTPASGMTASGSPGGPFQPSSCVYTVTNAGYGPVTWSASKTQPWVTLSQEGGILESGAHTDITASINSSAASLPIGEYSDMITITNTTSGDGNTTRSVHLSVVRNYEVAGADFNWIDPSGHASFVLSDDGVTSAQAMPFGFNFYGTTYNQVYVGANGLLGFASIGLSQYENAHIPSITVPNAAIYPYWDDLDPSAGGHVHIGTVGTAPYRRLVVTWEGVPPFSSNLPLTFQAVLCETTGDIIFQYLQVQPGDPINGAGRSATIGIENADGSLAYEYSFDGRVPVSNGQAIRFSVNRNVSIPEAMKLPDGVGCTIRNVAVTAVPSTDLFYVEALDRFGGVAVYKSAHGMHPDAKVDVQGTMATDASGERYVNAVNIIPYEVKTTIRPLLMPNLRLGGADWCYDDVTKTGKQGVTGGIGLNNIGLLIATTGRVTYSDSACFYVDDGSGLRDNSTHTGIKVLGTVPVLPGVDPVGEYVVVTGISSCFKGDAPDTGIYRLVRATGVQVINE